MDLLEHLNNNSSERHPWELARFELMLSILNKNNTLKSSNLIADIGCGDTFVVNSLAQQYPQKKYIAIDSAFTDKDIEYFTSNSSNNTTLLKNINDLNIKQNIDIVLLMDVIEHIDIDIDFLKELSNNKSVNHNTKFLITAPAFNSLFSAHDTYLKHYRRYNNRELQKIAKQAGFDIQSSGYFFSSLLIIRILEKFKEIIFGKKKQKGLNEKEYSKKTTNIIKSFLLL